MTFKTLTPILYTSDLPATIGFYTNFLGFTIHAGDADTGWASLRRDQVEIMLSLPNAHIPFDKAIFTGSFYINTDQVDELWDSLKERTRIVYDLQDFDYGMREFAIYDNNGYVIQFGQPLT